MKTRMFASTGVFALAFVVAGLALSGCNNETPPADNAGSAGANSAGTAGTAGAGTPNIDKTSAGNASSGGTNSAGSAGTAGAGAPNIDKTGASAPPPAGKTFTIGMSQCNLGEPWRVQMNTDIDEAAKKHPEIKMIFKDAGNKSETQQSQMQEFIQQKVDLIIISPKESRPLTRPVGDAMDAGIPVIVLDRAIEGDKYTCFIGGDNKKIGMEAGKYMAKILNGKGDIIELQGLGTSTPAKDRHDGFMEGIKGTDIKIIFAADCKWLEPDAQKEMNSALSRFPKIDAVYGHNDPSAHGAYKAAEQEGKGREKTIKFIGIDALPTEGVKYVKDGILTATFQYPTGGPEAIETALKILNKQPFEKKIVLGTKRFTKDNVDKGGDPL
ncbi:MAG TPA: substrate-binding domain-containing protein [Chthonomonadaceae bacterium]|nr:substrate-binding domain-containing protein [Chthonomonadaceae bacterium]